MLKSIQILLLCLLVAALTGCGSSVTDLAAVKANMKREQLALSEPVSNSVGMVLVPIPAGEFLMGDVRQ